MHPQAESYHGSVNPIGPRSCCDEGKRCAETLFFHYRRQHNRNIKVARIFSTYGPRMHPNDGRVVSNFVVQALCGQPITIFGDGKQSRYFCYVSDLIKAFLLLMDSPPDFTGPINLGNPGEFTMLELAQLVCELTESQSTIALREGLQELIRHSIFSVAHPRMRCYTPRSQDLFVGLAHTNDAYCAVTPQLYSQEICLWR